MLKLIFINNGQIKSFFFNEADSEMMRSRCQLAGKQWSERLLGFMINSNKEKCYAAITVQDVDGTVESMEYQDIERKIPEFSIPKELLTYLINQPENSEIKLAEFESVLNSILVAPLRAREWHVYPAINSQYILI